MLQSDAKEPIACEKAVKLICGTCPTLAGRVRGTPTENHGRRAPVLRHRWHRGVGRGNLHAGRDQQGCFYGYFPSKDAAIEAVAGEHSSAIDSLATIDGREALIVHVFPLGMIATIALSDGADSHLMKGALRKLLTVPGSESADADR